MAMTTTIKDELAGLRVDEASARKAEVAATLRFTNALRLVQGRYIIEADLSTEAAARRLASLLREHFEVVADVISSPGSQSGRSVRGSHYYVRVVRHAERVARQAGLIDGRGLPRRGMPPEVVRGSVADAISVWRGAFLAAGALGAAGYSGLAIATPSPEAALALIGAARRFGVSAKARDLRGVGYVVIRDGDDILQLLTIMNASASAVAWDASLKRRPQNAIGDRSVVTLDVANQHRVGVAAQAAIARVERAYEILGSDIPEHLREVGDLRLQFRDMSLDDLGKKASTRLSKDTVAGRLRRLMESADIEARRRGVPDTKQSVTTEHLAAA